MVDYKINPLKIKSIKTSKAALQIVILFSTNGWWLKIDELIHTHLRFLLACKPTEAVFYEKVPGKIKYHFHT